MKDAISAPKVGGIVRLTRFILKGTMLIETAGAVLLLPVFLSDYGLKGIWMSVFHSVSAFCNAGFDILGTADNAFPSLVGYSGNVLINVVIMLLIITGGIGFLTWDECREMAKSGLVEFASHTNDCHIRPDAPGIERKSGEDEETYISRISADLQTSITRIELETGQNVTTFTYPLGKMELWAERFCLAALCRHTLRRLRHCPLRRLPLPPAALQHHGSSSRQRVPPRLLTGSQELRILKASISPIKRDDKERAHE